VGGRKHVDSASVFAHREFVVKPLKIEDLQIAGRKKVVSFMSEVLLAMTEQRLSLES
jgi:hypothetical protein